MLIHGFSASPDEFRLLKVQLKEKGIPFLSPRLTGFGLTTPKKLKNVHAEDWLNDGLNAYRQLDSLCNQVDVVAHSMGSIIILILATRVKFGNIILTAPYLLPKLNHQKYVRILQIPGIYQLFKIFRPIIVKSIPEESNRRLVYHTVPVQAVAALWRLSDMLKLKTPKINKLTVIFGKHDNTIEEQTAREYLSSKSLKPKYYVFNDSGHNILEDKEADEVIKLIMGILG